jgi:hypothetical protein
MIADAGFVVEGASTETLPPHRRPHSSPMVPGIRRRGAGTALPGNA